MPTFKSSVLLKILKAFHHPPCWATMAFVRVSLSPSTFSEDMAGENRVVFRRVKNWNFPNFLLWRFWQFIKTKSKMALWRHYSEWRAHNSTQPFTFGTVRYCTPSISAWKLPLRSPGDHQKTLPKDNVYVVKTKLSNTNIFFTDAIFCRPVTICGTEIKTIMTQ